jgi:hypothetical protein
MSTIGEGGCGRSKVISDPLLHPAERGALGKITIQGPTASIRRCRAASTRWMLHTAGISDRGKGCVDRHGALSCGRTHNPASRMACRLHRHAPSRTANPHRRRWSRDKGIAAAPQGHILLLPPVRAQGRSAPPRRELDATCASRPARPPTSQTDQGHRRTRLPTRRASASSGWHLARRRAGRRRMARRRTGSWSPPRKLQPFVIGVRCQIESVDADPAGGSIDDTAGAAGCAQSTVLRGGADPGLPSAANYGAGAATNIRACGRAQRKRALICTPTICAYGPDARCRRGPGRSQPALGRRVSAFLPGFGEAVDPERLRSEKFGKATARSMPTDYTSTWAGDVRPKRHLMDSNSILRTATNKMR